MNIWHKAMKKIMVILLAAIVATAAMARVNTTRKGLSRQHTAAENLVVPFDTVAADTLQGGKCSFVEGGIVLKGYSKRLSDRYETFFVTNNTGSPIGHVTITFVYTDMKGATLHSRTETVACNLAQGETAMAQIRSFDTKRLYYYAGPKPRRSATPYKLKVRIESYEVVMKR